MQAQKEVAQDMYCLRCKQRRSISEVYDGVVIRYGYIASLYLIVCGVCEHTIVRIYATHPQEQR